jgi:flagellar protein FlaG
MESKAALTALVQELSAQNPIVSPTVPGSSSDGDVVSDARKAEARKSATEQKIDNGPQPGDLRLVIEEDIDSGVYVYKTVDRRTGETLKQYPREDVLRFKDAASYGPGKIYDGLT